MQTKWNNKYLDEMRMTGDPFADVIVEILFKKQNTEVLQTLRIISERHHARLHPQKSTPHEAFLLDNLSAEGIKKVDEYYNHFDNFHLKCTDQDIKYFEKSAEIFNKYGYLITTLLFFKSLPTGYLCPKPGNVLHTTRLLEDFAARRVMETSQFIFAVNTKDWYKAGSQGMLAIEKVRLMHAGMRVAILNNPQKPWDKATQGVPINQEDITLTNHLFSLAIIEGLDDMGIHLFEEERIAIYRTWQHIGLAMGIEVHMLNESYDDAWVQYKTILKRQVSEKNEAGPHLTLALLKAMNQITSIDMPMETLEDITRYFVDDRRSTKSLGLHSPSIFDQVLFFLLHLVLRSKIWQYLFHRTKGGRIQRWIVKIGNKILLSRFNLGSYLKAHPDVNPLDSFTKVLLASLSKRDLTQFKNQDINKIKKKFVIDSTLYAEWGLGGFESKVVLNDGIDESDIVTV